MIWLSGVRRVGKTTLARMVPDVVYLNCDVPSTRGALDDPELFLEGQEPGTALALDDAHRIADPSLLLKIAADEYPGLRILATGSSTLAAIGKFRDSLTGRKRVKSYIEALEIAHAVHLLRPFRGGSGGEIVSRPKCYAFDTGFVTFEKGWTRIREDDRGLLWEHLVLDSLRFRQLDENIFYWRDKAGREVDFVVRRDEGRLDTFECKIDPDEVEARAVKAFRRRYPQGRDYVVVPVTKRSYRIRRGGREFTVCGTKGLPGAQCGC